MYTQKVRLLKYLKRHGGLTIFHAMSELGILSLSSRIKDLEHDGHKINRFRVEVSNRFGEKCKVIKYCLAK